MSRKTIRASAKLRSLPSINALLRSGTARSLRPLVGAEHLTSLARRVTDELRQEMMAEGSGSAKQSDRGKIHSAADLLNEAERRLATAHEEEVTRGLRRVINATGVILHTNLGRAPLSEAARRAISEAADYCTLEYDLNAGSRGRRGARAEDLLTSLTGAEAALIVNNCAAAALLVLTVFAQHGETIVSRGELVEIGGDFRVPDVMAQSATRMIEVGTTNRTKLADYRQAISANTRLVMRVHTSNYRIVGFTNTPTLAELATLAHESGLLLYEDAGSGALIDFSAHGITGEPVIRESFAAGADVISFSGDKLLGGPQAGLLVGRAEIIERMRKHSLYRALRVDKFRLAALEATLESYARGTYARDLPTHSMISLSLDEMRSRAINFVNRIRQHHPATALELDLVEGESAIGGGAAPTSRLLTALISATHKTLTPNQIEESLRRSSPPVIARIEDGRVLLDLRTVFESDEPDLARAISGIAG